MCKKLVLTALLVAAGVWGYRHYNVIVTARKQESLEAQIRRERDRLPDLDGEIRKQISQVAAREIELKDLDKDIKRLEKQLEDTRKALSDRESTLSKDVSKNDTQRQRGLRELNRLADALERGEAELKARKEQFESYQEALAASHEELVAYQNERRSLETQLAQLDAMAASMRTEEIKGRVHFDKTRLAEASARIDKLRHQAEVRQKDRELQVRYLGNSAPVTPPPAEKDVLERVKRLLTAK
jgi:chromosome segregation ATPase